MAFDTNKYGKTVAYTDKTNIAPRLGIMESSAANAELGCIPKNLGKRIQVGDRVFYLAKIATATAAGSIYAVDASAANSAQLTNSCTAAAIGDNEITVTNAALASLAEDAYAEGYIFITDDAGEGQTLKIRANTAANTSNAVTFTVYDQLATAVTTASDVNLMKNPWANMIIADAAVDAGFIGGAAMVTSTAGDYVWLQSWGPASVLAGGAITAGTPAMIDTTRNGAVVTADGASGPTVGNCIHAGDGADGGQVLIDLTIRP
jgi:hypothetical protein